MADVEEIESAPDPKADIDAYLESRLEAEPDTLVPTESAPAVEAPPPAETVEQTAAPTAAPPAADQSQGQTPVQSKAYQDLLAKYGGNVETAAQAYWDTNNRAAQLARELEELKARQAQPSVPPTEPAKAPEPQPIPQELQRYDTDMRALDAQWKDAQAGLKECQTRKAPITREREKLGRQIISGNLDLDRQEAARERYNELLSAESEYDSEISRLEQLQAASIRDYRDLKERKGLVERVIAQESARQAEINKQNEASLTRFGQTFFTMLPTIAQEGTEKIPDRLMPRFKELCKKEALLRLTAPGLDLDQQDIPAFVREIKADFLALVKEGHQAQSAEYAVLKTADAGIKAPEGKKAVAPVSQTSKWNSQEELDAHLDAQLGL